METPTLHIPNLKASFVKDVAQFLADASDTEAKRSAMLELLNPSLAGAVEPHTSELFQDTRVHMTELLRLKLYSRLRNAHGVRVAFFIAQAAESLLIEHEAGLALTENEAFLNAHSAGWHLVYEVWVLAQIENDKWHRMYNRHTDHYRAEDNQ